MYQGKSWGEEWEAWGIWRIRLGLRVGFHDTDSGGSKRGGVGMVSLFWLIGRECPFGKCEMSE